MAEQGPSHQDLGRPYPAARAEAGTGREAVPPTAFVKFLAGQLDEHGKPPEIPHTGPLPDLDFSALQIFLVGMAGKESL